MNFSIGVFQGFSDSLETPVLRKLMTASTFYYFSTEYKKIKRITWILLALIFNTDCSDSKHFNIIVSVS